MQDKNCEKTVNYGRMWFPEYDFSGGGQSHTGVYLKYAK